MCSVIQTFISNEDQDIIEVIMMEVSGQVVLISDNEIFLTTEKRLQTYRKEDIIEQTKDGDITTLVLKSHIHPTRDVPIDFTVLACNSSVEVAR